MTEIETFWEIIDAQVSRLCTETIPVAAACGAVLAEPVRAPHDLPRFDHSAMDGYVFAEPPQGTYKVAGEIAAGCMDLPVLKTGMALRIFTGAQVPKGAFAVVPQENCIVNLNQVRVNSVDPIRSGDCIRRCAAIFSQDEIILDAKTLLSAGGIAFLISCGVSTVPTVKRPHVLHVATGTELVEPGQPCLQGQIHDSNGPMMESLLKTVYCSFKRERLPDDAERLCEQVRTFSGDLLLISGGSGPGDHDHTARALTQAGFCIHVSRVNSRPGKPLIFATRENQVAFGIPGNPLSHWVCFHAFVQRALHHLQGVAPPPWVDAQCCSWNPQAGDGRRQWTPARLFLENGQVWVNPFPWQHSGDLSTLNAANALLLDTPDTETLKIRALTCSPYYY